MPCGLISTTTTFASGLPLASLTRPVIVTFTRGGAVVSTGVVGVSTVGVGDATGEASGVALG